MTLADVDLSRYDVPGRGRGLLDVFTRRYLLRLLVRQGTATRYRNSVLGWTWSYVKPGTQFIVFYFVMGVVLRLHEDIEYFPVYLFTGIILVNFFNEAFGNATNAIVDNRALVRKIYLPRELFPVAAIIVALIHFMPQAAILLLVCIAVGWTPSLFSIAVGLAAILMMAALALGLGLVFGAVNVRFRDAQNIVEVIRMVSVWSAPTMYPWFMVRDAVPDWVFAIYYSNPLAIGVELFHAAFWGPTISGEIQWPPNLTTHIMIAVSVCVVSLVAGQFVFRSLERSFAQDL